MASHPAWVRVTRYLPYLILCSVLTAACSGSGAKEVAVSVNKQPDGPFTITVAKAEARDVPQVIRATGTLVADESSRVAPKVAGKVANVFVNVGDFVGGGSQIIKIDDTNARQQLATARANVRQATAGVRQAEARLGLGPNGSFVASAIPEVRLAAANHEQAMAQQRQAETNEQRYRDLVETGDVAMITYDQYRTQRDTARTQTAAAKQALDAAINNARQNNQAIATARAAVDAAQNNVSIAEQAIADTIVRAPFSGFVSERPVAVGEYVTSASPVATVLRSNPIKVNALIGESDVPQVSIGRGVSVQVDAYKDRSFAGTVSAINPAIDPASRSATIEAQIENANNALRSGMFATVNITRAGVGKSVFVPKTAVYNAQATQSYRVFVIEEGVAKLKIVQIGVEEGDMIEIVTGGVNPDDTVATSKVDELYEGALVAF